jgi:hypothetical protein
MSVGELEAAVAATASSIDGRRFSFQCPVQGLELQPGGYAVFAGASARCSTWSWPLPTTWS